MNAADAIAALELPPAARLDSRVAKKLLTENAASTAADRRAVNEQVEELVWVAALKPNTIGVPAYSDAERDYPELEVLHLAARSTAKTGRLVDLVHRSIPYPILLIVTEGGAVALSTAHKRRSLGEGGKVVLDGDRVEVRLDETGDARWLPAFGDALALVNQPRTSMLSLYQGWVDTLVALIAARITGTFTVLPSAGDPGARHAATTEYAHVAAEMARVRSLAVRETQMPRQVELNAELGRLRAAQEAARAKLA